ncbi:MAG: hypothetical protein AB7G37_11175 [Solirubrobacteraceae bacterium]
MSLSRRLAVTAIALLPLLAAPAADAKRSKPKIKTCASVVVRPNLATPQGPVKVLRAATSIKTKRVTCRGARRLIGSMTLQVASDPQQWPNERSWWTQARWVVAKTANATARDGGRFELHRHGGRRIWFTLWY